jgi:hypothetical protein
MQLRHGSVRFFQSTLEAIRGLADKSRVPPGSHVPSPSSRLNCTPRNTRGDDHENPGCDDDESGLLCAVG